MKYFTPKDLAPSETTLSIIRQVARRYRVMKGDSEALPWCMN